MPRSAPSKERLPSDMKVQSCAHRLRLAIVYGRNPLPMRHADQMTVAHLISFLHARGHAVDLYTISDGGEPSDRERSWLESRCRAVYIYRRTLLSVTNAAIRVFTRGLPLQVALFDHPKQRTDVRRNVESGRYDLVYTYYVRSAEITRGLSMLSGVPTILALQLSQTLNARRIAKNAPHLFYSLLYRLESYLMARYEARVWADFNACALIGPRDLATIETTSDQLGLPKISNAFFSAHGTDVSRFAPQDDAGTEPDSIVFSGVMKTPTNVNAVIWFCQHVWPTVKKSCPRATFTIVGREPSPDVLRLQDIDGVSVTGTVPDTAEFIAKAMVCVNPMQAGGGMQNKLIEYLASGKAVVATSVANEGIGAEHQKHLLIADTAEAFAAAVITLLNNRAARQRLGTEARSFAVHEWSWESHFLKLEEKMLTLVAENLHLHHGGTRA